MSNSKAVAKLIAKFAPAIAAEIHRARAHLSTHFPRGFELVYDNYNALVFAYSSSEHASDAILSIAGYPKWTTLFFAEGATLDDPSNILEGSGSKFRSVRLQPLSRLHEPAVQKLIRAAKLAASSKLKTAPTLVTVVKSIAAKQRPRRPAGVKARAGASRNRKNLDEV